MNLFLIGYRCTGKSTVGRALARRLGWPFVDTDQMVVQTVGVSITRMVDSHGWPFFRQQERKALQAVCAGDCQVVATGGGIVLDPRNIGAMKKTGKVVWLTAAESTIRTRMLTDESTAGSRPSLSKQGLIAEIASTLTQRSPLYEKTADLQTATDRDSAAVICDRIIAALDLAAPLRP